MNRDMSKIIVIDWDDKSYQLQPRNALHRLKKWEGDENDTDLVHLASFLKSLLQNKIQNLKLLSKIFLIESDKQKWN